MEGELASRTDQRAFHWSENVERIDEQHMTNGGEIDIVSGELLRGRPRFGWMNDVKESVNAKRTTAQTARQIALDRSEVKLSSSSRTGLLVHFQLKPAYNLCML